MQSYAVDFSGADEGPPSTDAYKRAVYKQPPRNFAVEVLPPQKFGNAYSYGMLISPLRDNLDRHSIISRSSGSSGSSGDSQTSTAVLSALETSTTAPLTTDYEVWRRWEDCLFFQDVLEVEYARMSREKRGRLLAGKGVKKDGVYVHQDPIRRLQRAASFESLPPGPDPSTIAKDVHEILPRLTKKGILFKASKETIEQRGQEFKALIEALLQEGDDVPSLIRELRQLRSVRDFFGFWRRDQDRIEKQSGKLAEGLRRRSESMGSRVSSIFSSSGGSGIYFSPSNLSLQLSSQTIPEHLPTNKSPRRPVFMQGGKGAMNLVRPSSSEAGPSTEPTTPRRRAQTLQATSSTTATLSANDPKADIQSPPASAPAHVTFTDAMDGGYSSDSTGAKSSRTASSPRTLSPTASPRSTRSRRGPMEIRFSDIILADGADAQRKSLIDDGGAPIIVNFEEGETLSFEEEGGLFGGREHGHFASSSTGSRLGGLHRLQDLIIKEEDERDFEDERADGQHGYARSGSQQSGSRARHETGESIGYRESASLDRVDDAHAVHDVERLRKSTPSHLSTLTSSAHIAAARREALRSLTGGDALNALSVRNDESTDMQSARSSVLTATSGSGSGSGSSSRSTNSGHLHSSDTQSSTDGRPYSYQSSMASCEDIDRTFSSSPIILHSPLLEEFDDDSGYPTDRQQIASTSRDSVSSVQTFMTETAVDTIIPPRPPRETRAISPRPATPSRFGPRADNNSQGREDMVELRDSYFFGLPTTSNESSDHGLGGFPRDSGLDHVSAPASNGHLRHLETEVTHALSHHHGPTSPLSSNAHNASRPSTRPDATVLTMRSISPSPSVDTYAPSIVSSFSEESGVNSVPVKAIYGEHIVAFRIDRNSSLGEVREKLRHKLVDQLGVALADKFSMAYKPPASVRVQELRRAAGRARSSSVSSVGLTDASSLRILFSQRDWAETVGSCPPGAKVTLHVLHG